MPNLTEDKESKMEKETQEIPHCFEQGGNQQRRSRDHGHQRNLHRYRQRIPWKRKEPTRKQEVRNAKVPPKGQPVPFRGPLSTREIQIDPELAATLGRLAGEQPLTTEGKVNQWLGDPKGRAASYSNPWWTPTKTQ